MVKDLEFVRAEAELTGARVGQAELSLATSQQLQTRD